MQFAAAVRPRKGSMGVYMHNINNEMKTYVEISFMITHH
jgi:hypothetical protein